MKSSETKWFCIVKGSLFLSSRKTVSSVPWQAGHLHLILSDTRGEMLQTLIEWFLRGQPSGMFPPNAGRISATLISRNRAGKKHPPCSPISTANWRHEVGSFPTHCVSYISSHLSTFHPRQRYRNIWVTTFTQYFPLHQWIFETDPSLEITLQVCLFF